MRIFLFVLSAIILNISCTSKDKKTSSLPANNDANIVQPQNENIDSTLLPVKKYFEKELAVWAQSFTGFNIDSFQLLHKSQYDTTDIAGENDLNKFYELYKPALCFSPDSSQFIDLYSSGIMLEKKGKKIIAVGDVDQGVMLCWPKENKWKKILSFGPSAAIEEALWISPTAFLLTGSMYNDDGKQAPIVIIGDTNMQDTRWFEANIIRPTTSTYEASGLKKLKIDEWE